VLKAISMALTNAFRAGIGIASAAFLGVMACFRIPNSDQFMGVILISSGVVVVNLSGAVPAETPMPPGS
jgi:small multidrug resistance pump